MSLLIALLFLVLGSPMSSSAAVQGDAAHLEPSLTGNPHVLFYEGFSTNQWIDSFDPEWGPKPAAHGRVVPADGVPSGRALRVTYPQGEIGGDSGFQFLSRFSHLKLEARDEAWVRYYIRFDSDFDFVKGGKLPGLCGGEANTGGHPSNGKDGWSARLMWRPGGKVVQYVYYPEQKSIYGDDFEWKIDGKNVHFVPGKWALVESRVKLNTPGQHDGEIQSWFNGKEALHVTGLRFRDIPDLKIDVFYFSTFFGGGDKSWAAKKLEHAEFSGFAIGDGPLGERK